jgi:hypothetical protein
MSLSNSKEPAYYKNEITEVEIKKLEKIFATMEKDYHSSEFLAPVDYIALGILDYPKVITHPMDLGTVKKNLLNGEYKIFEELMSDLNLIWQNCRTYNIPGSDIVKLADYCDKKMKNLIDKQFKNMKNKENSGKPKSNNNNSSLTLTQKTQLIELIRDQSNEGLTQIVKIILKECPKGIEDIDNEKLQIKIDMLDYRTYDLINQYIEKNNNNGDNNDKVKASKK